MDELSENKNTNEFLSDNTFDEKICNKLFSEKLNKLLDILKPKERQVLKFRFGLWNESDFDYERIISLVTEKIYKGEGKYGYSQTLTLEEIGFLYGVTRERVRQIESKALKKLPLPFVH